MTETMKPQPGQVWKKGSEERTVLEVTTHAIDPPRYFVLYTTTRTDRPGRHRSKVWQWEMWAVGAAVVSQAYNPH